MRNKGAIILVSVLFVLISLYYLSFTFVVNRIEGKADKYAQKQFEAMNLKVDEYEQIHILDSLSKRYLDSISDKIVYSMFKKYTYMDCKERELNLGLDLKGGMNISIEISAEDVILALANNQSDSTLLKALDDASKQIKEQTGMNYIDVFGQSYNKVKKANSPALASLFITTSNQDRITVKSTDQEVLKYISEEYDAALESAFDVLRKRIDHFGVVQPNIQKDVAVKGVFHIELPGIKDPERVEDLLKQAAVLEFWETYNVDEIYDKLSEANVMIADLKNVEKVMVEKPVVSEEVVLDDDEIVFDDDEIAAGKDTAITQEVKDTTKLNVSGSLFDRLVNQVGKYQIYGPVVGFAKESDMESIMADLNRPSIKRLFPDNLVFAWSFKPLKDQPGYYQLIALKKSKEGGAVLGGDVITNAQQEFGQNRATAEVTMSMNGPGSTEWARITRENVGKSIAIVLDGYVYSFPNVNDEIKGGRSSIMGDFTLEEATDLANVLKSGKMPAPASILSKEIVGPSLGQKAIDSGLNSFIIAFILVLIYMIFYYGKSGIIADIALIINLFLIFGVLASLGAVLTLPGIAGIVLTIGMSVDANVLIYERIREELRAGKMIKTAIADGYKNAYSAIIDSNLTTLLIGIILLNFGVGPVQGFATTLIIGILCSLFTAIFITRLIFTFLLDKDKKISLGNKLTMNAFQNLSIKFLEKRKLFYIISGALVIISLGSLFTRGLNQGIDFTGGRNYIIAFDKAISPEEVAVALEKVYGDRPVVKTFGVSNQVKISTKFEINNKNADNLADSLLYVGLQKFLPENTTMDDFFSDYRQESQKVGPTVADDIKSKSIVAILLGLVVMFLYILIRFRKWQYSLGALVALIHDVLIVMGIFSLFYTVMPFNMEIDQAFIAAILTVVGYSINDTVIVFDRIREYLKLYPKRGTLPVLNDAVNSTISRTINTSLSTLVVLIAIFIFGGEVIRGFIFALLIGIVVGTYSSICIATPISYDLMKKKKDESKK
ncbi:MAG TPA: protein translocase subunit SecDF [Bacteroidales bacterium]|nr:protein translocase subunit SecDF [Bacteroidales bacterium]